MTRTTKILIAAGVLALVCVIVVAGVVLGVVSIPPMSEQLAEGANRASVSIVYPSAGGTWPLNAHVPIRVMARAAEPIANVEVFINNTALETRHGVVSTWAGEWTWQPGAAGDFVITARVTTQGGAVSLSEPVRIHVGEAASGMTVVTAQGGETLADIAAAEGASLESLQAGNPKIDPAAALEKGAVIFVPDEPDAVTAVQLIEPLAASEGYEPVGEDEAQGPDAGAGSESGPIGKGATILENFNFMQKANDPGAAPDGVPAAPGLTGSTSNCDVNLVITGFYAGAWEDEDGFFVYRSRDGGEFKRIRTLPPVETVDDTKNLTVLDPKQYGDVTYYVSAFNVLGEAASEPLTFPLAGANCQAPSRGSAGEGKIGLQDGNLVLPHNMDLAYLYLQINKSKAQRVPEGDRFFLPESGIPFNVLKYIDALGADLPQPDLALHMEVWGWQGSQLIFVGEFDTAIHRTVLSICSMPGEGSCTGNGGGTWVNSLDLPQAQGLKELKYELRWQVTSLAASDGLYLQLAAAPFTGDAYSATSNLLYARQMWNITGQEGVFTFFLGSILFPEPPNTELGWGHPGVPTHIFDFTTNGFLDKPVGQPFTLYLRATPALKPAGVSDVSNVVPLTFKTSPPPADLPPLASPYSSIYDIEILKDTYSRPGFYDPTMWGCVQIEEDPTGKHQPGDIVCPGKEPPKSDCDNMSDAECLALGMLDQFGWVYDQFIFLYEYVKQVIIEVLWEVIPYCKEIPESICTEAVHKGVDYLAEYYTGIPNDAPSSDELIADSAAKTIMAALIEGEKYYTEQDFSVIEQACREELADCEKKISNEIKVQLRKDRSYKAQVACWAGPEVLIHGQHQACLDPVIACHAAPGAMNVPAMVLVRVTRKNTPEANAVLQSDDDKYRVMASVDATGMYPNSQNAFDEQLYETALVPIPWLAPGESVTVPATLKLLGEGGGLTKLLYFGSTSHMKAVEACYSPDSTWEWVPCLNGGMDAWEFKNGQEGTGTLQDTLSEEAEGVPSP